MTYRVRTWGLGWGIGGRTVEVSSDQFIYLMLSGRIQYSLGEQVRRRLWNRAVDEFESMLHPGADAACISHDQEA